MSLVDQGDSWVWGSDWRRATTVVWGDGMSKSPEMEERVNYLGKVIIMEGSEKAEES